MALPPIPQTTGEWGQPFKDRSHTERFVAAAVRIYKKTGQYIFTHNEIMDIYEKARWDKPQNPADAIAKAANRLFFAPPEESVEEGDLKKWQLTNTGLAHYEEMLQEMGIEDDNSVSNSNQE
jgi:hypothetical protein